MNIQQALKNATKKLEQQNISSANLDAEVLLLEALNRCRIYSNEGDIGQRRLQARKNNISKCRLQNYDNKKLDKSWLYINNDYILNENEEKLFDGFIQQRIKHKPVAYITNKKEFYNYDFYVDKNALIPRPETEIIVEEILKIIKRKKYFNNKINLIDVGTGSGCIIISILNELTKNKEDKVIHKAYANDISSGAIAIAKINAKKYNLNKKIKFVKDDLEKFLNKKNIFNLDETIITANLPYVKNNDYKNLAADIKKYEPRIALTAGKDGLDYIKKLVCSISEIKRKYKQFIYIFIEANPDQISAINALFKGKFDNIFIKTIKDLSQRERVVSIKIS